MAPPPGGGGQSTAPGWAPMVPMFILLIVFWVILIRPQMKKQKEHDQMLKTIKRGDTVVTNGGLKGIVLSVSDTTVAIRSNDSKLDLVKSAVAEIISRGGDSESDK